MATEFVMIDFVLMAVVAVSALIGLFRGFVREALSLVTWVAAIWCAWKFGNVAAGMLPDFVSDPVLKVWAVQFGILICVLILGGVLSWFIGMLLNMTGLTGTDRTVGMVFGLARGAIVAALLVTGLEFAGFADAPWWQESRLIPLAEPIAAQLREAANEGFAALDAEQSN